MGTRSPVGVEAVYWDLEDMVDDVEMFRGDREVGGVDRMLKRWKGRGSEDVTLAWGG